MLILRRIIELLFAKKPLTKSIVFLSYETLLQKTGGVELQMSRLARVLSIRNWDIHFVSTTTEPGKPGRVHRTAGMTYHWVRRSRYADWIRLDILRVIRRIRPGIVYLRGRSNLTASAISALLRSPKIVYHFAEDSDFDPTIWFHLNNRPHSLGTPLIRLLAAQKRFLFFRTIQRADLHFCQTRHHIEELRRVFGREGMLVPSLIEIENTPIQKENPPVVLWIAHAGRRKQLELFVQLASALKNEPARFIIGGTIPDAIYRQEIEERMAGLNNIEYVGPLSWEESQQWFSRASIFVNTTMPGREGFPNTYLQSWTHHVPVVTLNCDPDNLLEDFNMGFHSRSFDQMVDHVRQLLHDPAMQRAMGERAFRYVSTHHNTDVVGSEIDRVLTEMLPPSKLRTIHAGR